MIQQMINIHADGWYAHFFRGMELIVVYQDRLFSVTRTHWARSCPWNPHGAT